MCKISCWRSSKKPQGPSSKQKSKSSFFSHEVSVHVCWDGFKMVNRFELQSHPVSRFNLETWNKKAPLRASHLQKHSLLGLQEDLLLWMLKCKLELFLSLTNSPAVCPSQSLERALAWKSKSCEM